MSTEEPSPVTVQQRAGHRRTPWFVAKDVCDALGLLNPTKAVASLASNERNTLTIPEGRRGNPSKVVINESGLYALIFRSRKPAAIRFQDWVTGTVLPAIRKTGSYVVGEEKVVSGEMTDAELMARALLAANRKVERLRVERTAQPSSPPHQPPSEVIDVQATEVIEAAVSSGLAIDYGRQAPVPCAAD